MSRASRKNSPIDFTRRCSSNVYPVLLVALLLMGCSDGVSQPAEKNVEFDRHRVLIGNVPDETVLTGSLLEGPWVDFAVVTIEANEDRQLRIFSFVNKEWTPSVEATLNADVSFVDVASINGRDQLIAYGDGALHWFDPESKDELLLVSVECNFAPPRAGEIPHVDVTHDLNDDGRDDLVIPVADGFRIYIQDSEGGFSAPITIDGSTDMSGILGSDGYRYNPWSQSRVYRIDYNQDGRNDLVYWRADRFSVHLQNAYGLFAAESETFDVGVRFDSDDLFSLATGALTGRVLHSLRDMNDDGVADLVVYSLAGKNISKKQSRYEVHLGEPTSVGGIKFRENSDRVFTSDKRVVFGLEQRDFDQDGQLDLMITSIRKTYLVGSVWKSLKGFMGDDLKLNLEFYRQNEGHYSATPDGTRMVDFDGEPSNSEPGSVSLDIVLRGATHEKRKTQEVWPRAFNRPLLIGDVTGDGLADLLIGRTPEGMDIYRGVSGDRLFAADAQGERILLPSDGEFVWLVDFNKDGKQDILVHQPPAERAPVHPQARHRPPSVTTLIAR